MPDSIEGYYVVRLVSSAPSYKPPLEYRDTPTHFRPDTNPSQKWKTNPVDIRTFPCVNRSLPTRVRLDSLK